MNIGDKFQLHTVAFGRDGDALDLDTLEPYGDRNEFDTQINSIADAISQFRKATVENEKLRLLLYVHGALNSPKGARERAKREYQNILNDGMYPIFINWDAGMLSAYSEYLFEVRQGRKNRWLGLPTSPLYFAYDLARGIARLPVTWFYQILNRTRGWTGWGTFLRNAIWINQQTREIFEQSPGTEGVIRVSKEPDRDIRTKVEKAISGVLTLAFAAPRFLISPVLASTGTSAWIIYKRRTHNLFRKPDEFDVRDERKSETPNFQPVTRTGDLTYFLESLISRLGGEFLGGDSSKSPRAAFNQHISASLVGHSTGAIVLNNLITEFPDLNYSNIVYMGAACTIRDMYRTVVPYMLRNSEARFFVLTLDPKAELRESFFFLVPSGSLLEWIDIYFTSPPHNMDRVMGKWINLMATQHIFPKEIRHRVTLKRFRFNIEDQPQKHGEFDEFHNFHSEEFWSESPK